MRFAIKGIGLLLLPAIVAYSYLVFQNNRTVESATSDKVKTTFENSIWLEANREKVLAENNSILWLMIKRAGKISKDQLYS